jgi:hypothetical protein
MQEACFFSDEETEYEDESGKLIHVKIPVIRKTNEFKAIDELFELIDTLDGKRTEKRSERIEKLSNRNPLPFHYEIPAKFQSLKLLKN